MSTPSEEDQTLAELVARGYMTRRWDDARGWLYSLTAKGEAYGETLKKPAPAFCRECVARAAQSPAAVQLLLEMALEAADFHGTAAALLWDIAADDIDIVKRLRVMFTASQLPGQARELLVQLGHDGVRPHE